MRDKDSANKPFDEAAIIAQWTRRFPHIQLPTMPQSRPPAAKTEMGCATTGRENDKRGTYDTILAMSVPNSPTLKRILVVDDNQDILSFMQVALEKAGYEVQTAPEGAKALALQAKRRADLLITDIFMPVQDGIETLQECKTRFPQTRIIVMSAGGGTGGKLDYLPAAVLIGANATLRKPFNVDQLLDTVRNVLQF